MRNYIYLKDEVEIMFGSAAIVLEEQLSKNLFSSVILDIWKLFSSANFMVFACHIEV